MNDSVKDDLLCLTFLLNDLLGEHMTFFYLCMFLITGASYLFFTRMCVLKLSNAKPTKNVTKKKNLIAYFLESFFSIICV